MESSELDAKYFCFRAQQRVEKNDYKRAINDFTRAIRINPEDKEIFLLRAKAKVKCELYLKAIEDFNSYLECNSNNVNAFLDRGDCYLKAGSKEKALKDFNEACLLGSELGREKKEYLESFLKKGETYIKKLSKEINHGTTNPKTYFLRAMAYKNQDGGDYHLDINDLNKFVDYDLVINDLNKCIDLDPNYEDAYFERNNAKNILSDRYSKKEIDSDLEKYNSIRFKRVNAENLEANIQERHQKIQNNPLKTEILLYLIKNLEGKYSEEQIGIASGYFLKSGKSKILDKEKYQKANSKKVKSIDVKDNKKYPYNLRYASEFCIFHELFCLIDGEHGGRVFIPSRIVNESKEWDYSQAKLKDYNLNNLFDDNDLYLREEEPTDEAYKLGESMGFSREKTKEMHLESRQEREAELREEIEMHSFNEPMKYIDVEQYWFLDENLKSDEWFEIEEIAEFHGLRYEDCDPQSSWCDG